MRRSEAKRWRRRWLKRLLPFGVASGLVLTAGGLALSWPHSSEPTGGLTSVAFAAIGLPLAPPLRSLNGGSPWLNSPPLRPEDLKGKVVLVNFWTYSCINSARALPYVRAWAEKYRGQGLVVIGVHSPEFAFEGDAANVRQAAKEAGVTYPVVLDNDLAIWRAFDNEAWPAIYLIGADGRVRRRILGEGGYDKTEQLIQQLLSEARGAPVTAAIRPVAGVGPQAAPDAQDLGSPETYLGADRATGFAGTGGLRRDTPHRYALPPGLGLNHWALEGLWSAGPEFATLTTGPGRLTYRFHARDLHLILGPTASGRPVRFRVSIDGAPPQADHGFDVDAQGLGTVTEPRMYQLIRQTHAVRDRTFTIEFLDPGVRAYDFTFG